jgi:dephospho-CoA kinase
MPIDEKVGYADYVIHNEQSLEETRRKALDLWQTLRKIQGERK